jgi:flagellar biosynthetic protein FliO
MTAAPELIPSALKMAAALATVLGGLFVAVHFTRRYLRGSGGAARHGLMRVIATLPLGVKKSVTLVDVPDGVLVLGLSADRIQLLSRIEDPETLQRVRSQARAPGSTFQDYLAGFGVGRRTGGNED